MLMLCSFAEGLHGNHDESGATVFRMDSLQMRQKGPTCL